MTPIDEILSNESLLLHYVYNTKLNQGTLMMLSNRNYYGERERNMIMCGMAQSCAHLKILKQYVSQNPESPFIVFGDNITDCVGRMNFLSAPMTHNGCLTTKFGDEYAKFLKFVEVCYDVDDIEPAIDQVLMCGWESYYNYKLKGKGQQL